MREYKTGTQWCVWRWKNIGYIKRLHVFQCPWFSICVHWFRRPDEEEWLHDHPRTFFSVILRGSYWEYRDEPLPIRRTWFNWLPANREIRHRICIVEPGTVTLCFMGPRRQEWGYHRPERDGGWISWKNYDIIYGSRRRGL